MTNNYHTHTFRCHHADGEEREYIETAIARGLTTLGFSDHVPMPFPDGHESGYRIRITELGDYIAELQALREEYRGRINILIGFEAEYYRDRFEDMLALLGQYEYDYLLLGQHFVNNEVDGVRTGVPTESEDILRAYVDHTLEGLATGKFTYFAHPDVINFIGDDTVYERHMHRLCEECRRMEIPLEINLLGLKEGRHYPTERFFRIAAEVENVAVLGCDAHHVDDVANPEQIAMGVAFAKRCGIPVLETVPLRSPRG